MDVKYLEKLAVGVEAYILETKISQNDLAKEIGVSSSYLSHLKKRNFDNIPAGDGRTTVFSEPIARKIAIFLKMDVSIWDIENYVLVTNCLFEAKKFKEHRIIDGLKGSGKTFAIGMFKKQFPTETYIVTADDDMSPKAFLEDLAEQMGLHVSGSKRVVRKAIEEKIKSQRNTLIVIDEAENLKTGSYGAIKALYDAVKDYAGMVLVGANNYLDFLRKRAGQNKTPFTQLYSRFSAGPVLLGVIKKDDVRMVCKLNNIVDKPTVDEMHLKCSDYRELDRAVKRILRDRAMQIAA